MAEKNIKTRIIHKHDTEENWNKATNFIPKQGEIIVYDIDSSHSYERIKIGDGMTNVISLPYVSETVVDAELSATSENPVQNKVIYNALGEKLDVIPISLTSTTTEEKRTEFLTKIRSHFTETVTAYKHFFLTSPTSLKFELHYDADVGNPGYDLTATFAGLITVSYSGRSGTMILQGFALSCPYMTVDASNNITLIAPSSIPAIDYDTTQTYRPVALGTMKKYVDDALDKKVTEPSTNGLVRKWMSGVYDTVGVDGTMPDSPTNGSVPTTKLLKDYVEDNTSNPLKLSDTNLQKSGLLLQSYTPAGSTPDTVGTRTYSVIERDVSTLDDTNTGRGKVPSSYVVGEYVKEAVANKADINNPLSLSDTDITKSAVLIQHNYDGETPGGKYIARSIDTYNLSESLPAFLNIPTSYAVAQYVKNAINSAITTALNTEV